MKKVKITVLKTMLNEDLAKEYGIPGLKACPMMKVGDVFYADYAKPKGFCDEAWKAIYQYVFALAHGADKGRYPPRCYQHRGFLPSIMVTGRLGDWSFGRLVQRRSPTGYYEAEGNR